MLVDLLMKQGLVPYTGDEAELQRLVAAAYRALRDLVIASREKLFHLVPYADIQPIDVPAIQFLGLWDTVDAYGLPMDELTRAVDRYIWPLLMPDLDLAPRVLHARHALSVDDERNAFHPRLWNEAHELHGGNTTTTPIDDERISQVWFAGMHSDGGGGYPDDGLAYVSLGWIMEEAAHYGLGFCKTIQTQYLAQADENGPMHDSRQASKSWPIKTRIRKQRLKSAAARFTKAFCDESKPDTTVMHPSCCLRALPL